jgi:hypothetical protein
MLDLIIQDWPSHAHAKHKMYSDNTYTIPSQRQRHVTHGCRGGEGGDMGHACANSTVTLLPAAQETQHGARRLLLLLLLFFLFGSNTLLSHLLVALAAAHKPQAQSQQHSHHNATHNTWRQAHLVMLLLLCLPRRDRVALPNDI